MKSAPLAAVMAIVLVGCGEASAVPEEQVEGGAVTIASAAEGITSVVPFEDALVVTARLDGVEGDPGYVFEVGAMVEDIARAIQAGAADADHDATELDLSVSGSSTDSRGQARTVQVMRLTLPMADLRAADLDGLSVGRLLNLTTGLTATSQGAQQLAAYCRSERGLTQSRPFCQLAEAKIS